MKRVALIGNPNCGKTSLFNALTGCHGCVGNWAGVTSVACQARSCSEPGSKLCYQVVDFPGCYELPLPYTAELDQASSMEQEVVQALTACDKDAVDLFVHVVDASQLSRQLYMTVQLLEAGVPLMVVLSRCDMLNDKTFQIQEERLKQAIGCDVIKVSTRTGWGVRTLRTYLDQRLSCQEGKLQESNAYLGAHYPDPIRGLMHRVSPNNPPFFQLEQLLILEADACAPAFFFEQAYTQLMLGYPNGLAELIATCRRQCVDAWVNVCTCESKEPMQQRSLGVDAWLLHRLWGFPLFVLGLFSVFGLSMGLGLYAQACLEPLWSFLGVDCLSAFTKTVGLPEPLRIILTEGVGQGLVTAMSFFPLMMMVFMVLHGLEECGYMARSAVVLNRFMATVGLPGDAVVSLVLGLGCNVPGVAAASCSRSENDRTVAVLMMPFMSCSARLAIFVVFSQYFFAQSSVFALGFLYVLGIGVAIITGKLLRFVGYTTHNPTYLLELPAYQYPDLVRGVRLSWHKSVRFVWQAARCIVPVCICLSGLAHIDTHGRFMYERMSEWSLVAVFSKKLTVLFSPMGLEQKAWPLVLALCMGLLAKEVVLGTLGLFYAQEAGQVVGMEGVGGTLVEAASTRLGEIVEAVGNIAGYAIPGGSEVSVLPGLSEAFVSKHYAMAYMIFVLLYFPCVSTLFAIARSIGWKYAWLSVLWSFVVAYVCAVTYVHVVVLPYWLVLAGVFAIVSGVLLRRIYKVDVFSARWLGV